MSKKVIVVVYYWPPSGGIAVQRWLKMVAYFNEAGWEATIVAPEGADYPIIDEEIAKKVPKDVNILKIPIWEVRNIYKKLAGGKEGKDVKPDDLFFTDSTKRSWKQKISLWIRGNLFIPDARVTWVNPVVKYLRKYLERNTYQAIITTGPPHSVHLIGQKIKKSYPKIQWIADFRDPWTEIEYHDKMLLSNWAHHRHLKLESEVLKEADVITTVSETWAQNFRNKGADKVEVIINGFDEADFMEFESRDSSKFSISHIGTMVGDRWVETFWLAVKEIISENVEFAQDLTIRILGRTDEIIWSGIDRLELMDYVENLGIKSHKKAIDEMANASILLLIINRVEANSKGRLTGKIYEYIAAKKPILLIGPENGDAAKLVVQDGFGLAVGYDDKLKIKSAILEFYNNWREKEKEFLGKDISKFSRRYAAGELIKLLDNN